MWVSQWVCDRRKCIARYAHSNSRGLWNRADISNVSRRRHHCHCHRHRCCRHYTKRLTMFTMQTSSQMSISCVCSKFNLDYFNGWVIFRHSCSHLARWLLTLKFICFWILGIVDFQFEGKPKSITSKETESVHSHKWKPHRINLKELKKTARRKRVVY